MLNRFLILLFIICGSLQAQNNLLLTSKTGQPFTVIFDSIYNKHPEVSVLIKNISTDTLILKICFDSSSVSTHTFFLLNKGDKISRKEFDYFIIDNNQKISSQFVGMYDINDLKSAIVPQKPVLDTSNKYKNSVLGKFCEFKNGKVFFFNNKSDACREPMPNEYLNYLNTLMRRAYLPEEKYAIAESVTRNNCISVDQLSIILSYIEYELDKLKFLRSSYSSISDTNNKMKLAESFKFESSVNELKNIFRYSNTDKKMELAKCDSASHPKDLGKFSEEIAALPNDYDKLQLLKKSRQNFCFPVSYCHSILSGFLHDRERLEAAKILFFSCSEKGKFMKLGQAFSYSQTVHELQEFINKQSR